MYESSVEFDSIEMSWWDVELQCLDIPVTLLHLPTGLGSESYHSQVVWEWGGILSCDSENSCPGLLIRLSEKSSRVLELLCGR